MRYDDRLATVLRLTPVGQNVARIQYRQLLDLLGTSPSEMQSELVDAAYLRLAETSARISPHERAAMLSQPGLRLRSPRLVAALADGEPQVALATIRAATLDEEQWLDLIPALPLAARGLLGRRRDLGDRVRALLARLGIGDAALPDSPEARSEAEPAPAPAPAIEITHTPPAFQTATSPRAASETGALRGIEVESPPLPQPGDEIGAIVRRIEAFCRSREAGTPGNNGAGRIGSPAGGESPPLPLGLPPEEYGLAAHHAVQSFDFASDCEGRIVWSEQDVAPMVVGHMLGDPPALYNAIRRHQPLRAIRISLEGAPAITGEWQIDAVPRFDPLGGRFVGHLGRFRRSALTQAPASAREDSESDRLRQLLHELRTPVNAIQGFAEIIQQQLFGPAPHEYRALAANIAADSARMLAGFEELERYAKLDSGAMDLAAGESDLAECVTTTIARLEPHTSPRQSGFTLLRLVEELPLAIAPIEAERLCWRLLTTLAANAEPGEVLHLELGKDGRDAVFAMELPQSLAARDNASLYHAAAAPSGEAPCAGMFGTGFALRLAGAEARSVAGRLQRHGNALYLHLPGLTGAAMRHSQEGQGGELQAAIPAA